ncbi:MAG: pseudouridine synthase [Candidatus Melainabacteria bacterium]
MNNQPIRLNKAIADSGLCSRREADRLIENGHVAVNGNTVTLLGTQVNPARDSIRVHGKKLPQTETLYLAFHKPKGVVTTRRDERDRGTIYDWLPPECQAADPAGRLDRNSSGLLILSTDGRFLQALTHPSKGWVKRYRVTLDRPLTQADARKLLTGLKIPGDERLYVMQQITAVTTGVSEKRKPLYDMDLITGYNRQIRVSLEALGYEVQGLKRTEFGPVRLGRLKTGSVRPLSNTELRALKAVLPARASSKRGTKRKP